MATFTPTVGGPHIGAITITDNASKSPQVVRLFGTGVSGPIGAKVGLSSAMLNFGAQGTGTTSGSRTVTLTNTGDASLTVTSVTASGDFAQTHDCSSLAVSGTCTINVTFTPTLTGARVGVITIVDSAAGSPHLIPLFGLGTSGTAPAIGFSSARINFGSQVSSTTSSPRGILVTNTGTASLIITAVTGTGDFSVSGAACVTTLAPGATCIVSVTFTPTTTGDRRGSVAVTDNAAVSPQVIRLFGNGT